MEKYYLTDKNNPNIHFNRKLKCFCNVFVNVHFRGNVLDLSTLFPFFTTVVPYKHPLRRRSVEYSKRVTDSGKTTPVAAAAAETTARAVKALRLCVTL